MTDYRDQWQQMKYSIFGGDNEWQHSGHSDKEDIETEVVPQDFWNDVENMEAAATLMWDDNQTSNNNNNNNNANRGPSLPENAQIQQAILNTLQDHEMQNSTNAHDVEQDTEHEMLGIDYQDNTEDFSFM